MFLNVYIYCVSKKNVIKLQRDNILNVISGIVIHITIVV